MESTTTANASPLHALEAPTPEVVHAARTSGLRPRDWILFHLKIGLFGFGHGAIMPMYERVLVRDSRALTAEQFHEALTMALMLPGPSLITLSMHLGKVLFGSAIGLLGVLAMCIPGALWALFIIHAVPVRDPTVHALFRGFTVGALVLLVDMVRRMQRGLRAQSDVPARRDRRYLWRLALTGVVAALLLAHVPMAYVALGGVPVCLAVELLA